MKLYGIKNCDTVRKARKWLEKHNIAHEFHDFREQALMQESVAKWCQILGWETVFNKRSTSFRGLDEAQKTDLTEQKAIALMLEHPTLIKRPVLESLSNVMVGFKDADYQAWFKK